MRSARSPITERPSGDKYVAFISYSHQSDRRLAMGLQQGLQRIGVPWYRTTPYRVFRDDSSLSASATLWADIETALQGSSHLLLLASPAAARSDWVRREVDWWLANKDINRLLTGVTGGDINWDPHAGGVCP